MFGKKKEIAGPRTSSYCEEVWTLEFDVKTHTDRIAVKSLGDVVEPYAEYKMAIGRCQEALSNAAIGPKEAGEWQRRLTQHEGVARQVKGKITEQLDRSRIEAADLDEPVQTKVAVKIGLISPPDTQSPTETEMNVTERLLADAEDPKAKAKQERAMQKQQAKDVDASTREFLEIQASRSKELATTVNVKGIQEQTKMLNEEVAPPLEAQAKVVFEVEVAVLRGETDKPGLDAYKKQQTLKKLDQQLREVNPDADTEMGMDLD